MLAWILNLNFAATGAEVVVVSQGFVEMRTAAAGSVTLRAELAGVTEASASSVGSVEVT